MKHSFENLTRTRRLPFTAVLLLIALGSVLPGAYAVAGNGLLSTADTVKPGSKDTLNLDSLHYPLHDTRGDIFSDTLLQPFDLNNPLNLKDSIAYDPKTNLYYVYEKIGDLYYREPSAYTFQQLFDLLSQQSEDAYFQQRAAALDALNRNVNPNLQVYPSFFNRIFSSTGIPKLDIQPQGTIDIMAGYQGQRIDNPTLPERARQTGGLDFNMNANVNVNANIGDKMKLPISYNTQSAFDYENQLKLQYAGTTDDIIKHIDAGNINFTTKSSLIPSVQSLFGIKGELQFGKLFVTAALANQRAASQSVTLQGGNSTTTFDLKADAYDVNRDFLLAQYFKNNYNKYMAVAPLNISPINIQRIEVWVTNRQGASTNDRIIVGLADLGENQPSNPNIQGSPAGALPSNTSNNLYSKILANPTTFRDVTQVTSALAGIGLNQVTDYEKVYARKLGPNEYYYNPNIGFLCVNTQLQPNDVLAVAYQYTVNGQTYQVGEFSSDVTPDTNANNAGNQQTLFLKLLKATAARPNLPIWQLMMKNVYSIGSGTLQQNGFQLNVLYDEPGGGNKNYLPFGDAASRGIPILTLDGLDRLDANGDPQPDGQFDFLPNFTVLPQFSKIIFPVLQPFGRDLAAKIYVGAPPAAAADTLFYVLYDSLQYYAQNSPQVDRFELKGSFKGTSANKVSLNAFNIPPGSVVVTAGGQTLKENVDYMVDYNQGTVTILNQSIINSGVPVNVQYENNSTYGLVQRNFMGLRFDYNVFNTGKKQLDLGATFEKLAERPYYAKVQYGEDPIDNAMIGTDFSYKSDFPRMTKWLSALYPTTAPSSIQAHGEVAHLIPGHPAQIGKGTSGAVYIDDFEASSSGVDMRFPFTAWAAASTPYDATDPNGNIMFPEAALNDNLAYGENRARFAWYNIETTLQDPQSSDDPVANNAFVNSDPREGPISQQALFPEQSVDIGQNQLVTFDLAYFPTTRGQYNYVADGADVAPNGKLLNPTKRWGGMMRAIDQTDFQTGNVAYIEFWIMDPFIRNPSSLGGRLYFNLGNVSEDILKDGKHMYENGMNTPVNPAPEDTSAWGYVPRNPIQIINAFSNDPTERPYQDIGLDGMSDSAERRVRSGYLNQLVSVITANPAALQAANADPSSDDYVHYRDASYDQANADIIERYEFYNNTEGNSPVVSPSATYSTAATLYPDNEDLNGDNNVNEDEEYFQYHVDLLPAGNGEMQIGKNFITDERQVLMPMPNGTNIPETWYQFRIPVNQYEAMVGNPDFQSIQFMRVYMTDFTDDTVVVRFAELQLVRNQWRPFTYAIDSTGLYDTLQNSATTTFNITAVNIEQDNTRTPVPYVIPPGVARQQILSSNNVTLLQNEQSMSLQVYNLLPGDARAAFKTTSLDLRQYGQMQMFIHCEGALTTPNLQNGQVCAIIRIGQDFVANYYEIKIPLQVTPTNLAAAAYLDTIVWPTANNMDVTLQDLVQLKERRKGPITQLFSETFPSGVEYSVMGVPNLAQVSGVLIAVQNTGFINQPINTEVWVDELRLTQLNEKGGYAATGRVDMQLADLGTLSASGNVTTVGWGTIDQNVGERTLATTTQVDMSTNLELGKLLPKKAAISLPVFADHSQTASTPEYDPFDQDVKLKYEESQVGEKHAKDSIKNYADEVLDINTINLTNARKLRTGNQKQKILDIKNLDVSFSFTESQHHSPTLDEDMLKKYYAGFGYQYTGTPKYWQPWKKLKSKSHWLDPIRDFNINYKPTSLLYREDATRQFGVQQARNVVIPGVTDSNYQIPETFNKYFVLSKTYSVNWDFSKSLKLSFNAQDSARIDEPDGRIDDRQKRDSMWSNFFKGGRNTMWKQQAFAGYALPTTKIPAIDWTSINFVYGSTYNYQAASLLEEELGLDLGSTIENSLQRTGKVDFDMNKLYRKLKFFRRLDSANAPPPKPPPRPLPGQKHSPAPQVPAYRFVPPSKIEEFFGRLVSAVKTVSVSYSETNSTILPGFNDSSIIYGGDWRTGAPGLPFVFGYQPNAAWLESAAYHGWLTRDTSFNQMLTQTYDQELQAAANISPFKNLIVDVTLTKSFQKNFQELFKDTLGNNTFSQLSPYASGGFTVSYIAFKTLFKPFNPNVTSGTFYQFESEGGTLSKRLGEANPYTAGFFPTGGYYRGYGMFSQDVLIPSFIAAYTGANPEKIAILGQQNQNIRTDPFSGYKPMPNWHITYSGLAQLLGLTDIIKSINLTHAYSGSLSMNGFATNLNFGDPSGIGWPAFIDSTSGSYIPYFYVPNVTITENFAPLIGVDATLANGANARFSYSKGRTVSLSLIDYEVSDAHTSGFTFGGTWRKKGIVLPFKVPFSSKDTHVLDNDMIFKLDFSIMNAATANSIIDQNLTTPVAGSKTIKIDPSIDYTVNKRINVRLYYDRTRIIPYISSSPPNTNTRVGVEVRVNLAETVNLLPALGQLSGQQQPKQ